MARKHPKGKAPVQEHRLADDSALPPSGTEIRRGIIRKCIGGFYYVEAADAVYQCRARGIFRKQGITPVAGDRAVISVLADGEGSLDGIEERKNRLVRPPVANLDQLAVVASAAEPSPNALVMDIMIALAEKNRIEPLVVLNKADLQDPGEWVHLYQSAGFLVFPVSACSGAGLEPLRRALTGKTTAFTGNSGVGKSSLLNALNPCFQRETGAISQKLGRGRHTTRVTELLALEGGGYIVDTPGFTSLDLERTQRIEREELANCFREFRPFLGHCRFSDCSHRKEIGCAMLEALEQGKIPRQRYESYAAIYEEIKDWKEWN